MWLLDLWRYGVDGNFMNSSQKKGKPPMITDQLAAILAQAPVVYQRYADYMVDEIKAHDLDIQRKTADAVLDVIFEEQLTNHGNFYLMRKSAV